MAGFRRELRICKGLKSVGKPSPMATKRRTSAAVTRRRDSGGKQTLEVHRLGPHPLIEHFLERLDLARILDKHIHSNREGVLTHGRAICVLIHNVLVARDPLYRLSEWLEPIEARALGISEEQKLAINDDRMARALQQLAEHAGRGVFFQLALRSIKLFGLKVDRIHFDTTSVTFSGEYRTSGGRGNPHITRGHNKDGRPKLKQLVFGLNVTSDGAVPLSHGVFSGNRTDDTLHRENLDGLRDLLAKDDFIYVADCKLCTKPNLAYIDSFGGKFVTVLPRTRKEDAGFREQLRKKAARWRTILTVERTDRAYRIDTYATTRGPGKSDDGFRLIWIRSSAKAEDDRLYREKKLRKAKAALEDLAGRLNKRKLKAEREIRKAYKKILKEHACADFLRVKIKKKYESRTKRLKPGRPKRGDSFGWVTETIYRLEVSENAVRLRQEANTDGVFPLVTNLSQKAAKKVDVLQIYRYQPYIERRFENLKTEYAVRPVYLKKPIRVVGLVHVHFLALMVAALMEREIRSAMAAQKIDMLPLYPEARRCKAPTTPRILDLFGQAEWYRHLRDGEETIFPFRLSELQAQALKLLGVPRKEYEGYPFDTALQ